MLSGVVVRAGRGGELTTGCADQKRVQGAALVHTECTQDLVLDGGEPLFGRMQSCQSGGGELDDVAAAIVGVAPARDQTARFEVVE